MDSNRTTEHPGVEESLASYFQRSATIVRKYADCIEQEYAQPLLRYISLRFKEKPIAMTFLSVFAGLSALPLLSFAGLTIFTLSSIIFLALVSAAVTFITIEAILVAFLIFTLWSIFVVASFTTAVAVSVYWAMRLGAFVASEGTSGVTDWAHETRRYFHARKREATEESDGSAVLVDKDGPSSKKIKVEEEETTLCN